MTSSFSEGHARRTQAYASKRRATEALGLDL
jgi:hypothetical protein